MGTGSSSHGSHSVIRYADQPALSSRKTSSDAGSPAVVLVSLVEESVSETYKFRSYSCNGPSRMSSPHKVIMLFGATGAGKSTLINAMANYILGVKWEDDFRFQLIDQRGEASGSQAHSQTQNITSYTIHCNDPMIIPYTLTIIDTPGFGDTRGFERDKDIVDNIQEFFSCHQVHGVDQVDAICFVVQSSQVRLCETQSYIFESILGIFGKDVEPNILLMITFCDGLSSNVLELVQKAKLSFGHSFQFNNSTVFANRGNNHLLKLWSMGYESLNIFFDVVNNLLPVRLIITQKVLEQRQCLEMALKGLHPLIHLACENMEQLNIHKEKLEEHEQEIEVNKSFEFMADVPKLKRVRDVEGSTNCPNCLHTCHNPCNYSRVKRLCHAMSFGNCTACPGKCPSSDHVHEYFRYQWKMVKEKQTHPDMENRCRDAKGKQRTRKEAIKTVEADLAKTEAAANKLIAKSNSCIQRLEEIALKPNPTGVNEYLDLLIETEKETKIPGWKKRVGSLTTAKQIEKTRDAVKKAAESGNLMGNFWSTVTNQ